MYSLYAGVLDLSLMPGEAAAIFCKAECWLWWELFHEEIDQGHLADLLIPDDYLAPSQVFNPPTPF